MYKNNKLILMQKDVHVGDQVDFLVKPILYFGVTKNLDYGRAFFTFEIMSKIEKFDLNNYPNGMVVTLIQQAGGGKYEFSAQSQDIRCIYVN